MHVPVILADSTHESALQNTRLCHLSARGYFGNENLIP